MPNIDNLSTRNASLIIVHIYTCHIVYNFHYCEKMKIHNILLNMQRLIMSDDWCVKFPDIPITNCSKEIINEYDDCSCNEQYPYNDLPQISLNDAQSYLKICENLPHYAVYADRRVHQCEPTRTVIVDETGAMNISEDTIYTENIVISVRNILHAEPGKTSPLTDEDYHRIIEHVGKFLPPELKHMSVVIFSCLTPHSRQLIANRAIIQNPIENLLTYQRFRTQLGLFPIYEEIIRYVVSRDIAYLPILIKHIVTSCEYASDIMPFESFIGVIRTIVRDTTPASTAVCNTMCYELSAWYASRLKDIDRFWQI